MNDRKPILITGSHRSGTTWTGKMISLAPHVGYIHEPFNINMAFTTNPRPFPFWFQYITETNEADYLEPLKSVMEFRYPLVQKLLKMRNPADVKRIMKEQGSSLLHRIRKDRPLLKDPIALFSSEWLFRRFNMDMLIIIRHPAAFCSSLKVLNWEHDFNHFIKQPLLMKELLAPFAGDIKEFVARKKSIVEQGILLWNCIHHVIGIYQDKHPEWVYLKHEDLSLDPYSQFKMIYEKFHLEFTEKAKKTILDSSGEHNIVDPMITQGHKRNSKKNIATWKKRLSAEEIDLIRTKTDAIAKRYYGSEDW